MFFCVTWHFFLTLLIFLDFLRPCMTLPDLLWLTWPPLTLSDLIWPLLTSSDSLDLTWPWLTSPNLPWSPDLVWPDQSWPRLTYSRIWSDFVWPRLTSYLTLLDFAWVLISSPQHFLKFFGPYGFRVQEDLFKPSRPQIKTTVFWEKNTGTKSWSF